MTGNRSAPNVYRTPDLSRRAFRYQWLDGPAAASREDITRACRGLFDSSYGLWGPHGHNPGEQVRLSRSRLLGLLSAPDTWIAMAWSPSPASVSPNRQTGLMVPDAVPPASDETSEEIRQSDDLVGYCIVTRARISDSRIVNWVTQLVVRADVRKLRIATTLLYSVWQFSDCYAWGLATANPFAVRALETATRRGCRRSLIVERGDDLVRTLAETITYLPIALAAAAGRRIPAVDTQFFVSHEGLERLKQNAARPGRRWALGDITEGQEWFAVTFADQEPADVGGDRLEHLLETGDAAWIDAYERMALDDQHAWHRHGEAEIRYVVDRLSQVLPERQINSLKWLDVGCGDGRHVRELLRLGVDARGVDIAPRLINKARNLQTHDDGRFAVHDGRHPLPDAAFDVVTMLYDVVGSSARVDDDQQLLRNAASALRPGGVLVLSVMNGVPVIAAMPEHLVAHDKEDLVRKLESLAPSNSMERTGSVFDAASIVRHDGVFYRKEQFLRSGDALPAEMIVRDRRFDAQTIISMVTAVGLEVLDARPVQAGHWTRNTPLEPTDSRAKEWLVFARRGQ